MALDYVKNLRELDAVGGGEVLRPSVKRTDEDLAKLEANARAIEHENGRYGRFQDQQGNWAIAWQAPGPRTPLVAPRFVSPGVIRRNQGGELVLQPPEGEPLLIHPQQWVVMFGEGADAIIADDDEFRRVMTPEDRVARKRQLVDEERDEPDATEKSAERAYGRVVDPWPGEVTGTAAPIPTQTISVDGFVAQVLADNARLRHELAVAIRQRGDAEHQVQQNAEASIAWQKEAERFRQRGIMVWGWIVKAMGHDDPSDPRGPVDRDVLEFLQEAGRIWAEDQAKVAGDAVERPKPEDETPEVPAETPPAKLSPTTRRPLEKKA